VALGLVVVLWPDVTTSVVLVVIALWAVATGVARLLAFARVRPVHGDRTLALSGALATVFGLGLVAFATAGGLTVVWALALFAVASGALFIVSGVRLRSGGRAAGAALTA
jgi:uncharacterized membrane protein HdeD (DUF308 family)